MIAGLAPAGAVLAEADSTPATAVQTSQRAFSERTDQELTVLLATKLDSLDEAQRRALITEVKLRMARNTGRDRAIRVQTQRRYGRRIIRQRDGSVVRIQTQVVRVRPVPDGQSPYGVGFEQRYKKPNQATSPAPAEATAPPVMTVNEPSR